jgi:hypothetical protein
VWTPTRQHATLNVILVHALSVILEMPHAGISMVLLYGELDATGHVSQPPELNDGITKLWR